MDISVCYDKECAGQNKFTRVLGTLIDIIFRYGLYEQVYVLPLHPLAGEVFTNAYRYVGNIQGNIYKICNIYKIINRSIYSLYMLESAYAFSYKHISVVWCSCSIQ